MSNPADHQRERQPEDREPEWGPGRHSDRRGVFAISVAARMVSMSMQNLRVYERRGLLEPDRTPGGTRLYSPADITRLHRIRVLLEEGLNLAGVGRVLALEDEVRRLRKALDRTRGRGGS